MNEWSTEPRGVSEETAQTLKAILNEFLEHCEADVVGIYRNVTTQSGDLVWILDRGSGRGACADGDRYFDPSQLCRAERRTRFLTLGDSDFSLYVDAGIAATSGLKSVALFRHVVEGESLVVAFGFRRTEDFNSAGADAVTISAVLQEWAAKFALAFRLRQWPLRCLATISSVTCELRDLVQRVRDLDQLVGQVGELIYDTLILREATASVSFWLADHPRQRLVCKYNFDPAGVELSRTELRFGEGLVGWVAKRRKMINVKPDDPDQRLDDGTFVRDQYISLWQNRERANAEVVVPMIYRDRLIGVLNVECAAPTRFSPELEFLAEWLCTHVAMAIHQLQVHQLFRGILASEDLEQLAAHILQEGGNLVEAACSALFSWDIENQRLLLHGANSRKSRAGEPVLWVPGRLYYESPGVGFTRWAFDYGMPLVVNSVEALAKPNHPGHLREIERFERQVLEAARRSAGDSDVELVPVAETADERRCWDLLAAGRQPRRIWQPIWSGLYVEESIVDQSVMLVPVLNPSSANADTDRVLGVIRFSRWPGEKPFSEDDVHLVEDVARQIAEVISRNREKESQLRQSQTIARIVATEPGRLGQVFQQQRLRQELQRIREVLGADVVLVRGAEGGEDDMELVLLASDPWSDSESPGDVAVPNVVHLGWGPTGQAALDREPVYVEKETDKVLVNLRERAFGGLELAFINRLKSVAAVPLLVDGRVIGTLAAVSFQNRAHRVSWDPKASKWCCDMRGLQPQSVDLLLYHSGWLAPSVAVLLELERRQRHEVTISTAVDKLTGLVSRGAAAVDFCVPGLVLATHHDGFRFHQAFLAKCIYHEGEVPKLAPMVDHPWASRWSSAWGSVTAEERDHAINSQQSLDHDIDGALTRSDVGEPIRKLWNAVGTIRVPEIPTQACIFAREPCPEQAGGPAGVRWLCPGEHGDGVAQFLDRICGVFGIDPASDSGRHLEVGMVPLDEEKPPAGVLLVTRVVFDFQAPPRVRSLSVEAMASLYSLGQIFGLSHQIQERRNLIARMDGLRTDLAPIIHAGLMTNLAIVTGLEEGIQSGNLDRTALDNFVRGVMRLFQAQRLCYNVIAARMLGQPISPPPKNLMDIGETVRPLLEEFTTFLRQVMNISVTWEGPPSDCSDRCALPADYLQAALTTILWTICEMVQGDERAKLRGIHLNCRQRDGQMQFCVKYWGQQADLQLGIGGAYGRPWDTGLLIRSIREIIEVCEGTLSCRADGDGQVIVLALPLLAVAADQEDGASSHVDPAR